MSIHKINNITPQKADTLEKLLVELAEKFGERRIKTLRYTMEILGSLNLTEQLICASVDIFRLREKLVTESELKKIYGEEFTHIIVLAAGLESFSMFKSSTEEAENTRKMFFAMAEDLRVILLVLASSLARMRNLTAYDSAKQARIIHYANDIYAPLAARLGLSKIKGEMEDIILSYNQPEVYVDIKNLCHTYWGSIENSLAELSETLKAELTGLKIKGEVFWRQKHISSIYKKLQNKISIKEIYDLAAVRILVNTAEECYHVLGRIHALYKPIPHRIKDYIAVPKQNGYQSLHTTIIYTNNKPIEIQIRTYAMHTVCEHGVAAHWMYKEKRTKQTDLDAKIGWVREILENEKELTPEGFMEAIKIDLESDSVFVQTPKGKVLEFTRGSTVIDFAYRIHSDIGDKCTGALINGRIVPLSTHLKNGDKIEILTHPQSKGPSKHWLFSCKMQSTKQKINAFFRRIEAEETSVAEKKPDPQKVHEVHKMKPRPETRTSGIVITGDDNVLFHFAHCCNPIMGDEIIGYASRGRGVVIHRKSCLNLQYLEPERLLSAVWEEKSKVPQTAILKLLVFDGSKVLASITDLLTKLKVNITALSAKVLNAEKATINLCIIITNRDELNKVIHKLMAEPYVIEVSRG